MSRGYAKRRGSRNAGASKGERRPPLTHFLSLPLITSSSRVELSAGLERLRQSIASSNQNTAGQFVRAIPSEAIRPIDSIHLTLGVMSFQEDKLEQAIALLRRLDIPRLLEPPTFEQTEAVQSSAPVPPLDITLQSLLSMHSPTDTSVLYAEAMDASQRLYRFGERLKAQFEGAGVMVPDKRPLKLHATLFNTVYVKNKPRIDATNLQKEFKSFVWAKDIHIERVAICKMGAKKEFDAHGELLSEKYEEVASIDLP